MADPHSLSIGDTVTHPSWAEGTTRTVLGFSPFKRLGWKGKRRVLAPDTQTRIVYLNEAVESDDSCGPEDAWMEAGLEKVNA